MKKRSLAPVLILTLATAGLSAQKSQEALKEAAAKKLAKPFVTAADWVLDYDKARAGAKQQGKWILTYFTRSYSP